MGSDTPRWTSHDAYVCRKQPDGAWQPRQPDLVLEAATRVVKRSLLPILHTWGSLTGLHVLYLLYEAAPSEPFQLDPARFVSDPVLFLVRLYRDVQVGPEGPRARTGALQEDLRLLYTLAIR